LSSKTVRTRYLIGIGIGRLCQCDEIWAFCYSKEKNVAPADKGILGHGDAHTWTAIDADTKLAISWLVGRRDGECAEIFIGDLASRLAGRIQLTTDGHGPYLNAVEKVFGGAIDYAMLVKIYGEENANQKRYSPAQFVTAEKRRINGNPGYERSFYKLCGACKPDYAHGDAPFYSLNKWIQQEN
jgi:hypothetical protein